ncbi:universal stress protein [Paraburkholderia hospita]|uniref:universal stress protein n=1 Tax=Paraburkholderia hospita TaxID=169430 RepID=UPI0014050861|nr:universal stress protein [Paraburkholderia hospita]
MHASNSTLGSPPFSLTEINFRSALRFMMESRGHDLLLALMPRQGERVQKGGGMAAYANEGTGFGRVIVASIGVSGLQPLAQMALRLSAPGVCMRVIDLVVESGLTSTAGLLGNPNTSPSREIMLDAARSVLGAVARSLRRSNCTPEISLIEIVGKHASVANALVSEARIWHPDLLVISAATSDESGLDPLALVAATGRPVLFVPPNQRAVSDPHLARVLVAVDDTEASLSALRIAIRALPHESSLRVVHVVDRRREQQGAASRNVCGQKGVHLLRAFRMLLRSTCANRDFALIDLEDDLDEVMTVVEREADRWQANLVVASESKGIPIHGSRRAEQTVDENRLGNMPMPFLICPQVVDISMSASEGESVTSVVLDSHIDGPAG